MRLLIRQRRERHATLLPPRQHHHGLQRVRALNLKLAQKRTHHLILRTVEEVEHVFHGGELEVELVGAVLREVSYAKVAVARDRASDGVEGVHDEVEQCRFACAVGTQYPNPRIQIHAKVDLLQNPFVLGLFRPGGLVDRSVVERHVVDRNDGSSQRFRIGNGESPQGVDHDRFRCFQVHLLHHLNPTLYQLGPARTRPKLINKLHHVRPLIHVRLVHPHGILHELLRRLDVRVVVALVVIQLPIGEFDGVGGDLVEEGSIVGDDDEGVSVVLEVAFEPEDCF
mmetsp:Transcript_31709/g.66477  ORF Transcript_31709/g.66477 Transcript_31709/m.66477 type:complete len:283 (-) Transcript_31709:78-926(-)